MVTVEQEFVICPRIAAAIFIAPPMEAVSAKEPEQDAPLPWGSQDQKHVMS